jgi:mannitol-1-phosphate/altronate dehydrogenase
LMLMSAVGKRDDLMRRALEVFLKEVGPGLIHAHHRTEDPLFTEDGILSYAKDALKRMVNPFLNDPIERITRDPVRKLGWEDRLIGSMRLALDAGVQPLLLAEGAKVALVRASRETDTSPRQLLTKIWSREAGQEETNAVLNLLTD